MTAGTLFCLLYCLHLCLVGGQKMFVEQLQHGNVSIDMAAALQHVAVAKSFHARWPSLQINKCRHCVGIPTIWERFKINGCYKDNLICLDSPRVWTMHKQLCCPDATAADLCCHCVHKSDPKVISSWEQTLFHFHLNGCAHIQFLCLPRTINCVLWNGITLYWLWIGPLTPTI